MKSKLLGLKIKQLRSEHSLKIGKRFLQKDLADALGISRGYVGDIESGRTKPNDELLNKIANVFNVSLSFLNDSVPVGFYINSKKLKYLRHKKGLTQTDLSDALHLEDKSFIAKIERLEKGVSVNLLNKLSEFFNVSNNFLRDDDEFTICTKCGLTYSPLDDEDYKIHEGFHKKRINSLEEKTETYILKKDKQNIGESLNQNEIFLLSNFNKLNELGKNKALERITELTRINTYTDGYLMPIAAHDKKGNFTEEDIKHDMNIMNDDNFWNS